MRIKYHVVGLDAADLETDSSIWAGWFGGEVDRDDTLYPDRFTGE